MELVDASGVAAGCIGVFLKPLATAPETRLTRIGRYSWRSAKEKIWYLTRPDDRFVSLFITPTKLTAVSIWHCFFICIHTSYTLLLSCLNFRALSRTESSAASFTVTDS